MLPVDERQRVEAPILSLPEYFGVSTGARAYTPGPVARCLNAADLTTDEARRMLAAQRDQGGLHPNTPLVSMGEATWSEYTEEDDLSRQGVACRRWAKTVAFVNWPGR